MRERRICDGVADSVENIVCTKWLHLDEFAAANQPSQLHEVAGDIFHVLLRICSLHSEKSSSINVMLQFIRDLNSCVFAHDFTAILFNLSHCCFPGIGGFY